MRFAYHAGVAPMLWVFFGLALVEALVVHLLVTLKWPWLGWPLTILTGVSLVWLVRWIRSMRQLPHELDRAGLTLRIGSMSALRVPMASIDHVAANWDSGAHKAKGCRNMVPLAHPNRMLVLREPMAGRRGEIERIAFRVDDPVAFDAAMKEFRAAPAA